LTRSISVFLGLGSIAPMTLIAISSCTAKDIVEKPVITIGPQMNARARINELRRNADAVFRLAHAAFEYVVDAEFAPIAASVGAAALRRIPKKPPAPSARRRARARGAG
jgi:hypothetical protein